MILAIVIVAAAVLALIFILGLTISRNLQLSCRTSLAGQIQPIDIEAFRNLISTADDEFLRVNLASRQFRAVRRARLQAAAAYVLQAGRNAALLVRIGQSALASDDPRTREAARELVNDALLLRRNAAFALFRIYCALAWPNSGLAAAAIPDRYERLSSSAMLLGRLQDPAVPVRLAGTLR
jgi:hypothetical protein